MQENSYPGVFIVFEGIDGAGKTTQALKLLRWLQAGDSVVYTKEPTYGMPVGNKLRKALAGEIELRALPIQGLFIKDRDRHLHHYIIPKLGVGQTVLCDRYFLSTVAYGHAGGIDIDRLISMNQKIENFLLPDITIIIDVNPRVALRRTKAVHSGLDIFEKEETLGKVREAYRTLAGRFDNVYIINGERSEEEIFEDIKRLVSRVVRQRRSVRNQE